MAGAPVEAVGCPAGREDGSTEDAVTAKWSDHDTVNLARALFDAQKTGEKCAAATTSKRLPTEKDFKAWGAVKVSQ